MLDIDTFLTILYVLIDDFCKEQFPEAVEPGRPTTLTRSEVLTLAIFSHWYVFHSERDFYRWAQRHLKAAFPRMPDRSEYNRQVRKEHDVLGMFAVYLCQAMHAQETPYEVLDTSGVPVRNAKRRGAGWLDGMAKVGWCTRTGWFIGFRLLVAANREGVITGYGFAEGPTKEQPMTDSFLFLRQQPDARCAGVGQPARGAYLADQGFASQEKQAYWRTTYGVPLICQPQPNSAVRWPKPWRKWLHHLRQIVETVFDKLINFFRLEKTRPHAISGVQADLAAKVALHNFCIFLNKRLGRAPLAFSDLLDW